MLRVVDQQLELHRLDVALVAADIALRGKVGHYQLGNHLAVRGCAAGHHYAQHVAELRRHRSASRAAARTPRSGKVNHGDDRSGGGNHLALPRRTHVHDAGHRREHLRVSKLNLCLVKQRLRVSYVCAVRRYCLRCGFCLVGIRDRHIQRGLGRGDAFSALHPRLPGPRSARSAASSRDCALDHSLARQGYGAAGIRLLVLILCLGLQLEPPARRAVAPRHSAPGRWSARWSARSVSRDSSTLNFADSAVASAAACAAARSWLWMVATNCPAVTFWPSSTFSVWMSPGMRELTTTSLASTVPMSCRSPDRRAE